MFANIFSSSWKASVEGGIPLAYEAQIDINIPLHGWV